MRDVQSERTLGEFGCIPDAKSEINVRPPVFAFLRSRTSDGGATNASITGGVIKEFGAQASTFFGRNIGAAF